MRIKKAEGRTVVVTRKITFERNAFMRGPNRLGATLTVYAGEHKTQFKFVTLDALEHALLEMIVLREEARILAECFANESQRPASPGDHPNPKTPHAP